MPQPNVTHTHKYNRRIGDFIMANVVCLVVFNATLRPNSLLFDGFSKKENIPKQDPENE